MVQVIERTEGRYDVREFGEVLGWRPPERVVLECDCRARLVLDGRASVRYSELGVPECGFCGERFALMEDQRGHAATGWWGIPSPEEEPRYSWLEDYLERLEGKEARHEYYARLEERVTILR